MAKEKNTASPFSGDLDYLQAEFDHLSLKCRRLSAEREWRESQEPEALLLTRTLGRRKAPSVDEGARRVAHYRAREERSREELQARLKAHRQSVEEGFSAPLAMDTLCDQAGLSPCERQVLVATLVPALGEDFSRRIFSDLDIGFGTSLTAEGLAHLLEAHEIGDRLELRRLLSPGASLIKHELVTVDTGTRFVAPEDFWSNGVALSMKAFHQVLGLDAVDGEEATR